MGLRSSRFSRPSVLAASLTLASISSLGILAMVSGAPTQVGHTAGDTDLLVTWLYKLTIDRNMYNTGAVIGIFTFIVLAIVSLVTYRSSGSYKDEEGFM